MHALNRLTFGPRQGDSNRVMAMGVDQWMDQQLHPDKIDDHALEALLVPLRTLRMDTREIVENFPPERAIKAALIQLWPQKKQDSQMMNAHAGARSGCMPI